jgi:hypothetical protein
MAHNVPAVYDVLPARIKKARPKNRLGKSVYTWEAARTLEKTRPD